MYTVTKTLNGKKTIADNVTPLQKSLMAYVEKELEAKIPGVVAGITYQFQTNGKTKVGLQRAAQTADYTFTLPAFGTPKEEVESFGFLYGGIRSYEQYKDWRMSTNYKFLFVADYTFANEALIKSATEAVVETAPDTMKPQERTLIQVLDGKKAVMVAAAKKLLPDYDAIISTINDEVAVIRTLGYKQNITVTLQMKTKRSTLASSLPDAMKNVAIELNVRQDTMNGTVQQPLSLIKFVLRHQMGTWHHMLVHKNHKDWNKHSKQQWAMSYAYFRGSNPVFYSVTNKNAKIGGIGLPKNLWNEPEMNRPADLPAEEFNW